MAKKSRKKPKPRTGVIYLDKAKVERCLSRMGKSEKSFDEVSAGTFARVRAGYGVLPATAMRIAECLGRSLEELLRPGTSDVHEDTFAWPEPSEWTRVDGVRSDWDYTSNGLAYFRCQVRHRFIGDAKNPELGRARFYDLTGVPENARDEMRESLTRHAQVCRDFEECPHIVRNRSVVPVAGGSFWWVVDEWFAARTLQDRIDEGPIAVDEVLKIMRQVADGLQTLHAHKIVLRELAPRRVLIADDGQVRITELDLAKLLLRGKTVSTSWPVDVYRAPEVEGGVATQQSDYFSWGVMLLHAVTGDVTSADCDRERLKWLGVTEPLVHILEECLAPMPSNRPRSIDKIRKAVGV